MENQQVKVNMMLMFEWMMQEQCAMLEVTVAVGRLVQLHGQFRKKRKRKLKDIKLSRTREAKTGRQELGNQE